MFPGLAARIEQELLPLSPVDQVRIYLYHLSLLLQRVHLFLPSGDPADTLQDGIPKWNIRVEAPSHRKYTTWFGGSTIAPLCTYITREEFEEIGPASVGQTLF